MIKGTLPRPAWLPSAPTASEKCLIEGYAMAWSDKPDFNGWIVERGAFSIDGPIPPMAWDHCDYDFGKWESLHEDDFGLLARGYLHLGTDRGRRLARAIRYGVNRCLSITLSHLVTEDRPVGVRLIKQGRLYHISLCAMAANYHSMIHRIHLPGSPALNFRRLN